MYSIVLNPSVVKNHFFWIDITSIISDLRCKSIKIIIDIICLKILCLLTRCGFNSEKDFMKCFFS